MPECMKIWQHGTNDEADAAFRRCYAERAPRDSAFSKLVAQVRTAIAALPK
jgi:hypothetical protein